MPRQKNILLVLGWYDHRLHQGIARYAQEHGWHLSANLARERVIPWGWRGDGVLAWLGAGDDLVEFVESVRKPTVDFSLRRPQLPFARVLQDHEHAARLVAEHFLARGFKHFLFYSDTDNWSYEERGRGFVTALRQAGHECTWIRWHEAGVAHGHREEWTKRRAWLIAQVRRAPRPLAVFAANDQLAVDVLEACEQARLSVPEEVGIVGAENYLLAVDAMHTPISSVDTNLEEQGYEGAALLDTLMRGGSPPAKPVRVPASRVVARRSSDVLAVSHPAVARGLRFIWEHFQEDIRIEDIARAAALSRRGLHQTFLDHLDQTPGEELRARRIQHAKKLLMETDEKLESISKLSGYQSANSFCVAFKRSEGRSPMAYRKSVRPGR